MHKSTAWIAMFLAILGIGFTASARTQGSIEAKPGIVRVKLQPELVRQVGTSPVRRANGKLSTGAAALDIAAERVGVTRIRPMLPYNEKFAADRAAYGLDRWYVIEYDTIVPVAEARRVFSTVAGIELAEEVRPMVLKEGNGNAVAATRPPLKANAANYMFNDPQLPSQWHYRNFGNLANSVEGADINLFEAWQSVSGAPDVIVAIIDGGVDVTHEDLAANMFANEAELNGTPGVDDDGNGYVDDIWGFNFVTNSGEVYPHNHGTHVAGTVGAVNNNGIGVSGVAGGDGTPGSGVKMISCQVFESRSGTAEGDFAAAIVYAAERGASIAQCSWGWDGDGYYEQAVLDAIDYFTDKARGPKMTGGLCIFAAGNLGLQGKFYPAAYDKVVAVGAMTHDLHAASYSNYGDWIDVMAPGGLLDYSTNQGVLSTLPDNNYGYMEGTSMATPHVSGIAALVLQKNGSPTFVNESLRTQLLTSVRDFYSYPGNENLVGLFGSGYIDAAKALQMGDGSAPQTVSDFTADAAQDYIALTWTIPASADNNVHHHLVYYSTESFTEASDLTKIPVAMADTKFLNSGDSYSMEITGLQPLTKYYVAISAVNRWGAASPLSPVKEITTNAGPQIVVDSFGVNLTSQEGAPVATASFNIGNEGEGLLKWTATKRTVSASPASVVRPMVANTGSYRGKPAGMKVAARATVDSYEADDYPSEIQYFDDIFAYIGDNDRSLPNSMAQWFRIDPAVYPDGFNLTHVNITGANGQNPIIQIYKGDVALSTASLLQTIDYPYFAYGYPVALNEQLFFGAGEAFWVVVHFEGGQEGYPLGMCTASTEGIQSYSFMSNDLGKTWTQLNQALKGSPYETFADGMTWGITARSANPDWSEILELDPSAGTVRKGESQTVSLSADGSAVVNGNYTFNVRINTNQTENSVAVVPVNYSVTMNKADIVTPKIVNFSSLLVGESKTVDVEIYNKGYGSFKASQWGSGIFGDNITSTSEHFVGPEYISQGFPARTRVKFPVTYKPQTSGSHTGNIVFTDLNGNEVRIVVQGVATDPAKLAISPAEVECGTINVGDAPTSVTFEIANEGKYPLEYVFPKFSDESIEGNTSASHKFGYTVSSTLDGYQPFAYSYSPVIGGKDISSEFTDDSYVSKAVSLGFSFPYYGKTYDRVYITSFGGVMFAVNDDTFRAPLTPTSYGVAGTGLICAYGSQLLMGPASKVEYAKTDGKFVVNFENVLAPVYDTDYTPVSFRLMLSPNGDIEMYYDDYDSYGVFQEGSGLFCAINNPEIDDCLIVTSADIADYWGTQEPTADNSRFHSFGSGTAVKFEAPKPYFVAALNKPYGIVNPGEKVTVIATLIADGTMNAGATYNNLAILTNDPNPAFSAVRLNAVIAGDNLVAAAELEDSDIDFGEVFRTSALSLPVTVKNTGHDILTVNSATFANNALSTTASFPFTLEAGMAKDIIVDVPTDKEGAVSGEMTIITSVSTLTAKLHGTIIGCPAANVNITDIDETVAHGEALNKNLVIENTGNETLLYSITPDALVNFTLPENDKATTSYVYTFSDDDSSAKFAWNDIETTGIGEHNGFSYYMEHDYIAVDLPFEFPFYGEKYKKMYVYNTGFVSFTERHDDKLWPEPPAEFPSGSVYTNIIAPYWGMHSMDQTRTAGTFHYVDNDKAIVSFMEYGNSLNIGVCFQLILNRDGSFKFQYKGLDENAIIYNVFGLGGIANADGSSYIKIPARMMTFGKAVVFKPVIESPVAAGASETIGLDFNTRQMAGTYETALKIATNVPGNENIEIPVSLTITGEASPVWPEDMAIENVAGYQDTDYSKPLVQMGAMYSADFQIANTGTAPFSIDYVEVGGPTIVDDWFGFEMPAFNLFYYAEQIDWVTGEPTGEKSWMQYDGMPVTIGSDPALFSVPMLPSELAYTPDVYEVPVTFHYTNGEESGEKTVTITFTVTPPPAMTLDSEEIYVKAENDNDVLEGKATIGNEGAYDLKYTVRLDPTGVGEEAPEGGGGIAPSSAIAADAKRFATAHAMARAERANDMYNVPSDMDYRNALYYPVSASLNSYMFGTTTDNQEFKGVTVYTAPAEGFNVSHIYLPVSIENKKNLDVKIEIVSGNDPTTGDVLGKGTLHIANQDNPNVGRFFAVPLDRSVFLSGGEEFCVVVTYPRGPLRPAYLVTKEEAVVEGRYLGWDEMNGWYDVAASFKDTYGSLGFICTCLETVEGQPWIRLLTPEEGVVSVGATADIKVAVSAASARLEKGNKAMIVLKSNDPAMPLVNIPVVFDRNGTPVVDAPSSTVYTKEGELTKVEITVTEPDGDSFNIAHTDGAGYSRISSVSGATADENGNYVVAEGTGTATVNVEIMPEFGTASTGNAFVITATDSKGHNAEATVVYDIEHVNRAPIAENTNVTVNENETSDIVSFTPMFSDPDGDNLTYAFAMNSNNVADAYTTSDAVIFYGKKQGTVTATVTATDASGAQATAQITVTVSPNSSISDLGTDGGKLTVMPNPVEDMMHVSTGFSSADANFVLFDAGGKIVFRSNAALSDGRADINVSDLTSGIYILTATADGTTRTTRIVKR